MTRPSKTWGEEVDDQVRGWTIADPKQTFGQAVDDLHRRVRRLEANVFSGELTVSEIFDTKASLDRANANLDFGDPWLEREPYDLDESTC